MNKRNPVSPGKGEASPPLPSPYVYLRLGERISSTKAIFTGLSLIAIFVLLYFDKDVSKLEILVPAILGFYGAANVYQDVQLKKIAAEVKINEET